MEITKLVEKIEKELEARSIALDARDASLWEKSSKLEAQSISLDARLADLTDREEKLEPKLAKIVKVESKLKDEKEVEKERSEAFVAREQAETALKAVKEKEGDVKLALADLTKRELVLAEKERSYREEIKKEFMEKFLAR